jgi:hypothetical protein
MRGYVEGDRFPCSVQKLSGVLMRIQRELSFLSRGGGRQLGKQKKGPLRGNLHLRTKRSAGDQLRVQPGQMWKLCWSFRQTTEMDHSFAVFSILKEKIIPCTGRSSSVVSCCYERSSCIRWLSCWAFFCRYGNGLANKRASRGRCDLITGPTGASAGRGVMDGYPSQ